VPRLLLTSPIASERLARAEAWLAARPRGEEVLILGASQESATDLTRRVAKLHGPSFGWYRATLGRAAAALAGPELAARGIAAAGALALEAICARVVDTLSRSGGLGRLAAAADFPNLPRALARTIGEMRLAGLDPGRLRGEGTEELARIHAAYEAELGLAKIADRALILRFAADAVNGIDGVDGRPRTLGAASGLGPIVGHPLLIVDVAVTTALERELVAALSRRAPDVLATVPAGDEQSLRYLREALGVAAEAAAITIDDPARAPSLRRLQTYLFAEGPAPIGTLDGDVTFLSAPGESRECVEIARLAQQEAARGVPFDRMAILLRAPQPYRAHLEESLRRAGIPAHFARGSVRPDAGGRAFVALLACGAEKLSARRFAEYLSLGQLPDPTIEGAPPQAIPEVDRWVPPDDEIVRTAVVRGASFDALDGPIAEEERFVAAGPPSLAPLTMTGSVPAPRRWEQLLIESAVLGGLDRWSARLDGLQQKLTKELEGLDGNEPLQDRVRKSLVDLEALRRFALPLLQELALLPARATWGEWTTRLSALATRALRKPDRVLAALAELGPMAAVGPVTLDEIRLVLGRRLTDLVVLPEARAAGHIFVAPVDAARGLTFDVVFVPGLAEKLFPQKVSEDPILLDRSRRALGLDTNEQRVEQERLALRLAVGAARERIVLSYPRVDMDQSRPRVPSFYGLEVIRAAEGKLPGFDELARRAELHGGAARIGWPAPARLRDAIDDAEYDLALLETLFHRPEAETVGSAHYLLGANPHLARALRFRARRWNVKKWMSSDGLVDPGAAARAALSQHSLANRAYSATALQTFSTCPYKFLLYAVHRLSPREAPEAIEELGPRERGALVHEVLYEVLDTLRAEGALPITRENLDVASRRLDTVLARTAERYRDELAPAIERVWKDGIDSVLADLREWLRRAADDGAWTPRRFELSFGLRDRKSRDPSSTEASVELDCGIRLRGSIDLVEEDASGALRATDYKTGRAQVTGGAAIVNGGRTLQPVLYALALEKLFPEARIEAGRLYYCTSAGGFEATPIALDEPARRAADTVAKVIGKALSEGFLPAAPDAGACEYCEYRSVCGPYEELRTGRKSPERLHDLRALRKLV
jgi:CRISPR/Cas system-associated exonuclease Cas4 (RecB family)